MVKTRRSSSRSRRYAGRGKGNKKGKGLADLRKLCQRMRAYYSDVVTKQEEDENTEMFRLNDEVNIIDGHMDIIGNGKVVQIKPDPVINGRFHFFVYIETEMTFTDVLGSSKKFKKGTRQEVKPIYLRKRE